MIKSDTRIGDTVEITSGWFRRKKPQGTVVRKDVMKALVFGGDSLGSYKYEKLKLIKHTDGVNVELPNEILDAAREFVEKVKAFL